ncbi:hypothetical protein D4R20_01925 [bacterium]|nr:MAG: hypothetical protein D4R20_01925 [bacterium]
MKNNYSTFKFLLVLAIAVSVIFSCGKIKEMVKEESKKSDTEKEEKKSETSTKEESKKTESSSKEEKSTVNSGRLYFCEDYVQDEEIAVSEKFTTGLVTVMVKMENKITDKDVNLKLERLVNGEKEYVDKIAFTIPVTNYIFFKHKKLNFKRPGEYKVTLLGKDDNPIVSGRVTIVSK